MPHSWLPTLKIQKRLAYLQQNRTKKLTKTAQSAQANKSVEPARQILPGLGATAAGMCAVKVQTRSNVAFSEAIFERKKKIQN